MNKEQDTKNLFLRGYSMNDLLKIKEVVSTASISRATIYRLMKEGKFPNPIKISANSNRWRVSDIENWKSNPAEWGKAH